MIKKARIRLNLTQEELALRCKMSQSYVSRLENNDKCNITLDKITLLCKVLQINQSDFISFLQN